MTRSSRVKVESQNFSNHFESLVCKPELMLSKFQSNIFPILFIIYYKVVTNTQQHGGQSATILAAIVPVMEFRDSS